MISPVECLVQFSMGVFHNHVDTTTEFKGIRIVCDSEDGVFGVQKWYALSLR